MSDNGRHSAITHVRTLSTEGIAAMARNVAALGPPERIAIAAAANEAPATERTVVLGGTPTRTTILAREPLTAKSPVNGTAIIEETTLTLAAGERVRSARLVGGGFGPPVESAPEDVATDLADGKISPAAAERDYGAVVSRSD
ncbi:MAG: hypothetical protein AAFW98_11930 [Pseudomonadota bacterium]